MHDALVGLLDRVDAAVAQGSGVLAPDQVEPVATLARDVRLRLSYPEDVVVAALSGGTGSGKSSLLNAIAGDEVAMTGGIRPVTSEPLALVPSSNAAGLQGYLDAIGVADRVERGGPAWLCLLDLPDSDSVEVDHRHRVDSLLPRVDVIVWVMDPEKYRDAALHRRYIAPLALYQDQFLFVLNQVDRLPAGDAELITADLVQALEEDGISAPRVIGTAADPVAGPPIGVDRLIEALSRIGKENRAVHGKALSDLSAAARRLVDSAAGAHGIDFETRWSEQLEAAADLAVSGHVAGGAHDIAAFIASLAQEVEAGAGERLEALAVEAHASFVAAVGETGSAPDRRRRRSMRRRRTAGTEALVEGGREDVSRRVDEIIGNPVREILTQRGLAHAAITELALALGDLSRKTAGPRGR